MIDFLHLQSMSYCRKHHGKFGLRSLPLGTFVGGQLLYVLILAVLFFFPIFVVNAQTGSDPVVLFNAAQDLHEKGDLRGAVELYRRAIDLAKEFPEADLQLGNALRQLGDVKGAEDSYKSALELRPGWPPAIIAFSSLLTNLGRFADARSLFEKLDSAVEPELLRALAELTLRDGSGRKALADLLERLSRDETTEGVVLRARIEMSLGNSANARTLLLGETDKGGRLACIELAEFSLRNEDVGTAERLLECLRRSTPKFPSDRFLIARILNAAGKSSEALDELKLLGDSYPGASELRNSILVESVSDVNGLESLLEKSLEQSTERSAILDRLCIASRTSDKRKYVDYCRKAFEADRSSAARGARYGAALVRDERYQDAIYFLGGLRSDGLNSLQITQQIAVAYFQLKQWQKAKEEFEALEGLGTPKPIVFYFLGIVNDQLKLYSAALAQYERFLSLADPRESGEEIEKVKLRLPQLRRQIKEKR